MSRQKRKVVPQRRRIFLGCEGESEQGYVALLTRLAETQRLAVHLDAVLLQPGGGDPSSLVDLAIKRAGEREKRHRAFEGRFIRLDDDKLGISLDRDARIAPAANKAGLHLIWQHTCHEALLLRHLDGCAQRRPGSTALARAALTQAWQGYRKDMPATRLAEQIDREALVRAAGVEPALAGLLTTIGFIEPTPAMTTSARSMAIMPSSDTPATDKRLDPTASGFGGYRTSKEDYRGNIV